MTIRISLLASCLLFGCSASNEAPKSLPEAGEHAVQFRFLHDGQAEEFGGLLDAPYAVFRNDAHDLQIHASNTRSQIDPHHGGPEMDFLTLEIDLAGRNLRWQINDRSRKIERYRLASMAADNSGAIALVVQRQTGDGSILTSVKVLHKQLDDQESELPSYRGEMWSQVGQDIDHDGTIELLVPDQRFADAFGPSGKVPIPPQIYALQHGRYVDASRDGAYLEYYGTLRDTSAQACEITSVLLRPPIRAACFATLAGLSARSGHWPAMWQKLKVVNEDFANLALPDRARGVAWNEEMDTRMEAWGYIPIDRSARWWSKSWFDYYGEEHFGGLPFEVQQLIHDLQGCDHFSEEPAENPDGSVNERVVMMQEYYCLRPIGFGDFIGVNDIRWEWMRGKYRDDGPVRQLLENYDQLPESID